MSVKRSIEAADLQLPATFSTRSSKRIRRAAKISTPASAADITPPPSNDPSDDDNFTQPSKEPLHAIAAAAAAAALPSHSPTTSPRAHPTSETRDASLRAALHVLATESSAVSHIHNLYSTSPTAQTALLSAIDLIQASHARGGRLVICGVGKSGLVGAKTVATLKSLGVGAALLHAAEAMHGDLGDIRPDRDVLCFVTFSGTTGELLALLPHVPSSVPILAITAHPDPATCPLFAGRGPGCGPGQAVLLPATIPESEETSFGVRAPTTSTTVAITVGDMLALAAAERIHGGREEVKKTFDRNHPGGAIGVATIAAKVACKV